MDVSAISSLKRPCPLPRETGEGWGGGDPVATIQRLGSLAPLPTSPRERGEEPRTRRA